MPHALEKSKVGLACHSDTAGCTFAVGTEQMSGFCAWPDVPFRGALSQEL